MSEVSKIFKDESFLEVLEKNLWRKLDSLKGCPSVSEHSALPEIRIILRRSGNCRTLYVFNGKILVLTHDLSGITEEELQEKDIKPKLLKKFSFKMIRVFILNVAIKKQASMLVASANKFLNCVKEDLGLGDF